MFSSQRNNLYTQDESKRLDAEIAAMVDSDVSRPVRKRKRVNVPAMPTLEPESPRKQKVSSVFAALQPFNYRGTHSYGTLPKSHVSWKIIRDVSGDFVRVRIIEFSYFAEEQRNVSSQNWNVLAETTCTLKNILFIEYKSVQSCRSAK